MHKAKLPLDQVWGLLCLIVQASGPQTQSTRDVDWAEREAEVCALVLTWWGDSEYSTC